MSARAKIQIQQKPVSRCSSGAPADGSSQGIGRRGGSAADASLSAILRGDRDGGPHRHRPTTAAYDPVHVRAGITDGCDAVQTTRTMPCLAVTAARTTAATPVFNYELPTYHQSAGWKVCVVSTCDTEGVSALAATAPPNRPRNTPARTASASRRMRGVIKLTPFNWYETASSPPKSPIGSGISHATHRISPARVQTQTLLLAASCLSPTAMRMAK